MLCYFGRTRNGYIAIRILPCSSAATSSATGDYVVVPESFGQDKEPSSRNKDRTKKGQVLFPAVDLTDAILKHDPSSLFLCILCYLVVDIF